MDIKRNLRGGDSQNLCDIRKQRRLEGFALSEVIQALIIIRRQIWLKIQTDGYLDTALDFLSFITMSCAFLIGLFIMQLLAMKGRT